MALFVPLCSSTWYASMCIHSQSSFDLLRAKAQPRNTSTPERSLRSNFSDSLKCVNKKATLLLPTAYLGSSLPTAVAVTPSTRTSRRVANASKSNTPPNPIQFPSITNHDTTDIGSITVSSKTTANEETLLFRYCPSTWRRWVRICGPSHWSSWSQKYESRSHYGTCLVQKILLDCVENMAPAEQKVYLDHKMSDR